MPPSLSDPIQQTESMTIRLNGLGPDYAILDSRILNHLKKCGVIKEIPKPLTQGAYLQVEGKMRKWSKTISIPLDELDILLFHWETK